MSFAYLVDGSLLPPLMLGICGRQLGQILKVKEFSLGHDREEKKLRVECLCLTCLAEDETSMFTRVKETN